MPREGSRRSIHLWAPGFLDFGGGIASFSRELAIAFLAEGRHVNLLGKLDRKGVLDGVTVHGTGAIPAQIRTPLFAARAVTSAFVQRPDVVVSTHLNFGPAAQIAARMAACRFVLVAHGVEVHAELSLRRRNALRSADAVWAVSRWTRERLERVGVRRDRITVLSNTVDESRFSPGQKLRSLIDRYSLRPEQRVILTVARLHSSEAYKGYDAVLTALPRIRAAVGEVRYLIAGEGDDRPRIERMASDLGVADHVTFCGFVPEAELPDHYRLADAFAMPSRGEGFGIVFLEAMACGIPVLGGSADGTADALVDGELGLLVDPTNREAVADGLIRLLRHEGPSWWFTPALLRARMLERHGRPVFAERVRNALSMLSLA